MSTRWYPIFQKGNPQLRVYLPNFWMKLIKPEDSTRKNVVEFHCSMEMTRHDVKNYIEKIYKVPVVKVNTRIALGKIRKNELGTIIKEDDIKVAYVFLPRNESFQFPNLFEKKETKDQKEKGTDELDKKKQEFQNIVKANDKTRPGIPSWFSM